MTISLSDSDVRAASDMKRIIQSVEEVLVEEYDGKILMPPRSNLFNEGKFLRVMPVYLTRGGYFGYKSFHGSLENGVRYIIVLIRESDGELLAILDAAYLTAVRTGATSGVATKYMAPEGTASVGLIGSGLEAETNLAAISAVRPISRVKVFSRNEKRRAAFANRMTKELGIEIVPAGTAEEAVADTSIVIIATNTGHGGGVAFQGKWIEPGQHIVSIGSTSPFLREVDSDTFSNATKIIFDAPPDQIFDESGDLMAISGDLKQRLLSATTLPEIVALNNFTRTHQDVTLFKSVGSAAQDIISAKAIFDVAIERGLGRDIGVLAERKIF